MNYPNNEEIRRVIENHIGGTAGEIRTNWQSEVKGHRPFLLVHITATLGERTENYIVQRLDTETLFAYALTA